jgi:predicted nucleic acid-binding protein
MRFQVQPITFDVVSAALEIRERAGLSYWDSATVAAARLSGCSTLLSEDLSDGQDYDGVVVSNPFR